MSMHWPCTVHAIQCFIQGGGGGGALGSLPPPPQTHFFTQTFIIELYTDYSLMRLFLSLIMARISLIFTSFKSGPSMAILIRWVKFSSDKRFHTQHLPPSKLKILCETLQYTCTEHVLAMHCTCNIHALNMYWPCTVHAIYMHWTCIGHALYMQYTCTEHVLAMHCTCNIHALNMYWPCTVHAIYMHWTCIGHALYTYA